MPANLPPHIVDNIKTLNQIPALQERLKYLGVTTKMDLISILAPHQDDWIVCTGYNSLNLNINPGTIFHFNHTPTGQNIEEDTILSENLEGAQTLNIMGETNITNFQISISQPIHHIDGKFFGLFYGIGTVSSLENDINLKEIFNLNSRLLTTSIGLVERFDELNHRLRVELENAEKHATYMAILGHDLRNPVGTIRMCSDIIMKAGPNSIVKKNAELIKSSSYRMQELIDSMLDTAQSKFGDGIKVEKKVDNVLLASSLYHVVDEIMAVNYLEIKTSLKLKAPVNCDAERIAQLLSNLLANAVTHGDGKKIAMDARTTDKTFCLTVTNTGPIIPQEKIKKIFDPYFSDFNAHNKNGLGLGLFISSQIAASHGGTLTVNSDEEETQFILTIPL